MNKTVNTRDYAGERAVCSHTYYCNLNSIAYIVVILKNNPRIILRFSVTERNLSLFGIESLNVNLNCIAYEHNLRRILNSLPGKLRNVNHTVHTANVNKRAVACK